MSFIKRAGRDKRRRQRRLAPPATRPPVGGSSEFPAWGMKEIGEGGIRTLERGFHPFNGLANRPLQPLGHLTNEGLFNHFPPAAGKTSAEVRARNMGLWAQRDGPLALKKRWAFKHLNPMTFGLTLVL